MRGRHVKIQGCFLANIPVTSRNYSMFPGGGSSTTSPTRCNGSGRRGRCSFFLPFFTWSAFLLCLLRRTMARVTKRLMVKLPFCYFLGSSVYYSRNLGLLFRWIAWLFSSTIRLCFCITFYRIGSVNCFFCIFFFFVRRDSRYLLVKLRLNRYLLRFLGLRFIFNVRLLVCFFV